MKPKVVDFPGVFETERLEGRGPVMGDGAAINAAVVESIGEVGRWMPWARPAPGVEDTEKYCREAQGKFMVGEEFDYVLRLRGTGVVVGVVGLFNVRWEVPRAEMGYWLRTAYCGKGLMTEAVRAVTGLAFEHLRAERVEIRCDDRNGKSAAVAERAGFVLEGVLRRFARNLDGGLEDVRVYSKLRG